MNYKLLGRTGVQVSALCMGTMTFGREADEAACGLMYKRCRDQGVNFFDGADIYAGGRSEEILGRLIRPERDALVITSKFYGKTGPDLNARGTSRRHLMQAVEASLRRLQTDRLDLYYVHSFEPATDLEETLRGLDDLVRQGKILYPAASNFAAWQVARALGICDRRGYAPFVCIQPMYNLLKRQAEVELLPMAKAEQLGVVPYSPLGGGVLTGKYRAGAPPAGSRLAVSELYRVRYEDPDTRDTVDRFADFCRARGLPPPAAAIAWVAAHPAVTAPIIGARDPEQLDAALAAADLALTPELRAEISALSRTPPLATDRREEQLGIRAH